MPEEINPQQLEEELQGVLDDFAAACQLTPDDILVLGVSTSEVLGKAIGTAGSERIAGAIWDIIRDFQQERGFHLAVQCCEHLNRALVIERQTLTKFALTQVSAVPIPGAGGAFAALAFRRMLNPVLAEGVEASAGIDIGSTLIGMHLRPVAVPIRPRRPYVGRAHVTLAKTRPRLIGGARAVYA